MNPLHILHQHHSKAKWLLIVSLAFIFTAAHADLVVKIKPPKNTGSSAIIALELQNTFDEKIKSVRATLFLMDDQGKIAGQSTRWILGGGKDHPPLSPAAKTTYNFMIPVDKPFTKTKLMVTRLILDGDKLASLHAVQILSVDK